MYKYKLYIVNSFLLFLTKTNIVFVPTSKIRVDIYVHTQYKITIL